MDIIDTRIFQVLDTYFEKHGYTYVAKFRKERRSQKLYEKLEEMAKELKIKDI